MSKREYGENACSVVDAFCLAIPAMDGTTRARCFACGDKVCVNCSLVLPWLKFGRKRICHNCLLNHRIPNADQLIHAQSLRLAGYTE
jgi:hypothetical protein